jgi:MoaA/NifB/PqqE/SkfB family radical SAM enzyme
MPFDYVTNSLKLARQNRHLHPRVAIYYVTGQCNLNCAYCEDFGARRNPANEKPLAFEQAQQLLRVIRSGTDALFLTGGEPLTHPQIDELLAFARKELRFKEITLITNGLLLRDHEPILANIDRLIISLDSTNPTAWSQTIGMPPQSAETILANIQWAASRQEKDRFVMVVNSVLSPETLTGVKALIDFCVENKVLISFSPQSFNNWPRYELTTSIDYKAVIERIIALKKSGAPILGSMAYLKTLSNFEPYDCYPTLVPRIYPDGDLAYPCRPLEKGNNGQGGRSINLLDVKSWDNAWSNASASYGQPPRTCHSCFQQCYAEPSLMQAHPLSLVWENLRYHASRKGKLTTYAPG